MSISPFPTRRERNQATLFPVKSDASAFLRTRPMMNAATSPTHSVWPLFKQQSTVMRGNQQRELLRPWESVVGVNSRREITAVKPRLSIDAILLRIHSFPSLLHRRCICSLWMDLWQGDHGFSQKSFARTSKLGSVASWSNNFFFVGFKEWR